MRSLHRSSNPQPRLGEPVSLGQRMARGRPPIVWSLALLFVFKSLVGFAVAAFPLSTEQPGHVAGVGACVALIAAAAIWLLGSRIPLRGFQVIVAIGVIATSALVAAARTPGGMMVAAFSYPWIAIYAAHFFSRRAVAGLGLFASVAFAAGLAIGGLPNPIVYWLVVTITVWSICVVLGGLSEEVRHQVGTDQLTGALNRAGLAVAAKRERAIADRTGAPLTVAAIDLDDFKEINDRDGHAAGDRLLASLAGEWQDRLRPGDVLARHGGDEFVVLLPATLEAEAEAALSRLRFSEQRVSWSVGVCEWPSGEALQPVLARADARLYEAKLAKPGRAPAGHGHARGRLVHAGS